MLWQLSIKNCFAYNEYAIFVLLLLNVSTKIAIQLNCTLLFKSGRTGIRVGQTHSVLPYFFVPICTLEDVQSVKTKK